jgi:amino acid adenylation domain-containing protein
MVAILKAGCAYVPLSPEAPVERNEYILRDSGAITLLIQSSLTTAENYKSSWQNEIDVVVIDANDLDHNEAENPERSVRAEDLINVIYTSGTTGSPKGVEVKNIGIVNYIFWRISNFGYRETDVTLQLSPYSFDTYASNLYSSLLSGGALVLIPEENKLDSKYIVNAIRNHSVTNFCITPGFYNVVLDELDEEDDLDSLNFVVLAGEKASDKLLDKSAKKLPRVILHNEYGPTEGSVAATYNKGLNKKNASIIGKPISNVKIFILGNAKELLPIGVPGELHIGGVGLAKGYLQNSRLTEEKFVKNPWLDGQKMYKTGDLGRWLPDGNIDFLGRIDNQVKIRGYRIELGEIESQLLSHELIDEAVVIVSGQGTDKFIVAYCVSATPLENLKLKAYLSHRLPGYMVPSYIVQVKSIPLTSHGKLDRKALPKPEISTTADYTRASNEIEEKLVNIWSAILKIPADSISIHSNFFDLGGHSINIISLSQEINKHFNADISVANIFGLPTIARIGDYINKGCQSTNELAGVIEESLIEAVDNINLLSHLDD